MRFYFDTFPLKFWPNMKVTFGHSVNQSMVVQFTNAGYCRIRLRNASPIGDMQRITWRFARTRSIKNRKTSALVCVIPAFLAASDRLETTSSTSSGEYKFGTIPELRILFISSKNRSSTTCVSENRKQVGTFSTPAWYRVVKMAYLG